MIELNVTIGELVNEILPFSPKIEMNIINECIPYVKAYLSSGTGSLSKAIIYIIQTDENQYSVCDNNNDPLDRYVPSGSITNPFIYEKDAIHRWFNENHQPTSIRVKEKLNFETFREYFHCILFEYEIIRFDPNERNTRMSSMGFTSAKIRRVLDNSFTESHCKDNRIKDLIDLVKYQEKPFSLQTLRSRETACVVAKLKNIGLDPTIEKNFITKIEYMRRK